ncbi:Osmotin thaumatin-like protein [Lactarius quietus]|nr:Osmotin thaumatin-like protein [Lactarius quietus]
MIGFVLLALAQLLPGATAQQRRFTVVNTCPFTIWHIFTDLTVAQNVPAFPTGWESPPATSVQFNVPDNWKSGRIWGRRDCNFSSTTIGPSACLDGGCNGGLECDFHTGTGVPPATVAEWTLQGSGNLDYYDVSLVNGYNLPMAIIPAAPNCSVASCPVDLGPACPTPLVGPLDPTGFPVGVRARVMLSLTGLPVPNSSSCCTGYFNTAATCPTSGVDFYSYFKGNCPNSYAYAFDENSGTALWTCSSSLNSDYTLTFCPCGRTLTSLFAFCSHAFRIL